MKFRLSDVTKAMQSKSEYSAKKSAKYWNDKRFYMQHPELMPSNVYLYEGALISQKQWDKAIRTFERQVDFEIFRKNLKEKIKDFGSKVMRFFRKS